MNIDYAQGTRKRKLVLVVDVREANNRQLFTCIKERMDGIGAGDRVEVRQLDIFDFQYVFFDDRERTFGPHIERKTASDAAASIKDQRWKEQMGRAHHIPNKIHIFEGNLLAKDYGINPKSLIGAVVKPAMREEFGAVMTQNMNATADMLVTWFTYLEHVEDVKVVEQFSYVDCYQNEARKRDFKDENRLALMIKSFVQGGSAGVAKVVAETYPSLGVLQAAFLAGKMDTLKRLANLMYSVNDHLIRVGPAAAKEIYKMCDIDALNDSGVFNQEDTDQPPKKKRKSPAKTINNNNNNNNDSRKADDIVDIDDEEDDKELLLLLDKVEERYNGNKHN